MDGNLAMANSLEIEEPTMETFFWNTEDPHSDNNHTMADYLENHLDDQAEVIIQDGTYSEISLDGIIWGLHASGDGDCFNHKIEFEFIRPV